MKRQSKSLKLEENDAFQSAPATAHRALRLAVLVRAILDATGSNAEPAEVKQALWWFGEGVDSTESLLSLPQICEDLDLDIGRIQDIVSKLVASGIKVRRKNGVGFLDVVNALESRSSLQSSCLR